jgi:hypothetical protein
LSADSQSRLTETGIGDGQDLNLKHAAHYNHTNYTLFGTPRRQMYGKNVYRLREIRKQYDPHRAMELHRRSSDRLADLVICEYAMAKYVSMSES